MTANERVVAAAKGAVGARFRLHGREIETGLDCIGLAGLALRAGGWRGVPPTGYALRGGDPAVVATTIARGLVPGSGQQAGEVRLFRVGAGQLHLGIGTDEGLIHADAGLRRVVERPGIAPWPLIGAWTVRPDDEQQGE